MKDENIKNNRTKQHADKDSQYQTKQHPDKDGTDAGMSSSEKCTA